MSFSAPASLPLGKKLNILFWDLHVNASLFGLPLTYVGMFLARQGPPPVGEVFWITLAFVSARTFGFAANQLADREIDARHPIKKGRALPSKQISVPEMTIVAVLMASLFLLAAGSLNALCFYLAPLAMAYMVFYAYTKRFTSLTNLAMGATTSMGIAGGWLAVQGAFDWQTVYLFAASYFWVSGFDVMLDTRDYKFDLKLGLHTLVSRVGVPTALLLSRLFYGLSAALFLSLGPMFHLGPLFYACWLAASGVLILQQVIFRPYDFTQTWKVFFRFNTAFSALIMVGVVAGLAFR